MNIQKFPFPPNPSVLQRLSSVVGPLVPVATPCEEIPVHGTPYERGVTRWPCIVHDDHKCAFDFRCICKDANNQKEMEDVSALRQNNQG